MKKIISKIVFGVFIFSFLFGFVLLFLHSCTTNNNEIYHWEFEYSSDEIKEIKIITIFDTNDCYDIKKIDNYYAKEVYDDIKKIEMKKYSGTHLYEPIGFCFLITFNTGEYDIIAQRESQHYKFEDSELLPYTSWLYCDKTEFENLIKKIFIVKLKFYNLK